ncbi:hypothetical protein TNIN_16551 [Trichonephila inaurata madagascariensis]|uniref:Uncharacterized protein n=1 Tax=Trichonephila inaurata madagascariensis TaxID=2747483 RepID=A0A8X6WZC1_9ARAC|nr:hypothetical protein TNIN_16551 [Trichonephila inaurata madagascariensis]
MINFIRSKTRRTKEKKCETSKKNNFFHAYRNFSNLFFCSSLNGRVTTGVSRKENFGKQKPRYYERAESPGGQRHCSSFNNRRKRNEKPISSGGTRDTQCHP